MLSIFNSLFKNKPDSKMPPATHTPQDVQAFYNSNTDKFLEVYGEIIQAFRTINVGDYLDYTIKSAELQDGQKVLDAGCGVGGPASYFATKLNIDIEGATISDYQAQKSKEIIAAKTLKGTVNISVQDYHEVDKRFGEKIFDRVLFLESFGHSNDKAKAIKAAWNVLKPGGKLYIKDLFTRDAANEWEQLRINHICGQINKAYEYQIADLYEVLAVIRKQKFIINYMGVPKVEHGMFENLTISNDFQNLFDIGKIDSWDDYIFPIDFFEILVEKPLHTTEEQMHLYFMNRK